MRHTWTCPCCGQQQQSLPLDIAAAVPDPWREAEQAERDEGFLSQDLCYLGADRFLRVCLEIPIQGRQEAFTYGVWVSLSEASLKRVRALWSVPVPEDEPSKLGWLCTEIAEFPGSRGLKACFRLRDGNKRPLLELEPTDHPLSRAQREGLALHEVERLVARYLPAHAPRSGDDALVQKDNNAETAVNTGSKPVASS